MTFNPNSTFLFTVAGIVILFVIAQSVFFLVRSINRANSIGMSKVLIRKTILSTAIFTIAPAVSILLGMITLSKFLGLPLPWIRLSVVGAITYELPAATSTATAMGISLSETIADPKIFAAIAWVMTLGILPSTLLIPLFIKRIQKGLLTMKNKDNKWGELFISAMFMGMISAFLGMVFANVRVGLSGWLPVFVLMASSLIMAICGLLVKVYKIKWIENYALPISMLGAMAFAVLIAPMLTGGNG